MAPLRPVLKQCESGRQSAPFTIRPKVKSRTLKVPFSAALAGNFPCLWGAEPISSGSQPRDTGQTSSPPMRPIVFILIQIINLYMYLLIASAILSWLIAFNVVNTRNQFVSAIAEFLYRITEPVLGPIRRRLPSMGGLDISPIIAFFVLWLIQLYLVEYVYPYVP